MIHGLQLSIGKGLELDLKDGGLEGVQPGVDADAHIVILKAALAVNLVGIDEGCQLCVVGKNSATVAVAA